jgi:hypothetical protein
MAVSPESGRVLDPHSQKTTGSESQVKLTHDQGQDLAGASRVSSPVGFHRGAALTVCAAAIFFLACTSGPILPPFDGALPLGTWGSDSAGVIVSDTSMHLHIKCTFGDVSGRIPVDADGSFDVAGSYMLRAFPIAIGPPVPARFTGQVRGVHVTITVTVNDTVEHKTVVLGPVTATYGEEPRAWPCPICRRPIVTKRPYRSFRSSISDRIKPNAGQPPELIERSNQVRARDVSPLSRYQLPTP